MSASSVELQDKHQDAKYPDAAFIETVPSVDTGALNVVQADKLARKLSPRQVTMIAISGTIGTGLFLGTGKALVKGGPASLLLAYLIMGFIVFLTMLSLGEMSAFIPVAGSFCTFTNRFIDDAVGFGFTWIYWFNCAATTAADVIALQLVLRYWTTTFPGWAASLITLVILIGLNFFHVGIFGEVQYWLSLLKVVTIVIFVILGAAVNAGGNRSHTYIGGKNWHVGEAPFVSGVGGFASVFVTASFAYGGTESIAVTAGETRDPSKTMPKVVKTVFYRILGFYALTALIVGLNVPYNYPGLSQRSSATSPFTIVFMEAGSKAAGSFVNAVVLTSVVSAGNHTLFAGSRILYTLANMGYAPKVFERLNKNKLPWVAVLATSLISVICFGISYIGAGTIWSWLQNIIGVSNQITWFLIGCASLRFRSALKLQNMEHLLPFKNYTYPYGPWAVIGLNLFLVLVQGWDCFVPFSVADFISYYVLILVLIVMAGVWKLIKKTKFIRLEDMDLVTDRYDARMETRSSTAAFTEQGAEEALKPKSKLRRVYDKSIGLVF